MHSECYDISDEPSATKSIQFVTTEVVTVEVIDSILCQKFADNTEEADGLILRRDERSPTFYKLDIQLTPSIYMEISFASGSG